MKKSLIKKSRRFFMKKRQLSLILFLALWLVPTHGEISSAQEDVNNTYDDIVYLSSISDMTSINGFNKAIDDYHKNTTATPPPLEIPTFNQDTQIIHLPQNHKGPSHIKELVTISQFQITHTILKTINQGEEVVVFDEGQKEDKINISIMYALIYGWIDLSSIKKKLEFMSPDEIEAHWIKSLKNIKEQVRKQIKNGFPEGIPQAYEKLSLEQKDLLYKYGASNTLLYLGKIDQIHSSITKKEEEIALKNYDLSEEEYWAFDFREEKLKEKVVSLLSKNPNDKRKIFIIYGASHDFSDEFANYTFERGADSLSSTNLHWFLYSSLKGERFRKMNLRP